MYISKKMRESIRLKFNGLCAYSGTPLEPDWQIEHIKPVVRNWFNGTKVFKERECEENMVPVQKTINHYKHSLDLDQFRTWYLGGLHLRLQKLPKNPRTEKGQKRKDYLLKVAGYFGITEDNPFDGKFYFERLTVADQIIIHEEKEEMEDLQEDDYDFYVCMDCGNIQQSEFDCNKCCGPVTGHWL